MGSHLLVERGAQGGYCPGLPCPTAILLVKLMPAALRLCPVPRRCRLANEALQKEIVESGKTRSALLVEANRLKSEFLANMSH